MRRRNAVAAALGFLVLGGSLSAQNEKGVLTSGSSGVVGTSKVASSDPEFKRNMVLPEMTFGDEPKSDTVYFVPSIDMNFDPLFPGTYPVVIPMVRDYSGQRYLGSFEGITFSARGTYSEHPFLLTSRSASIGMAGHTGGLYYNLNAVATNYVTMPSGSLNQYGFTGIVRYQVSDIVSLTAFGNLYNVNPAFSMAAYPFVSTSRYGAYATIMGDNVGVDLGAQRYFDPIMGRWETAPIVTPKLKLGDNVYIQVPLGGAIKNGMERMQQRNQPPPPPPPARDRRH